MGEPALIYLETAPARKGSSCVVFLGLIFVAAALYVFFCVDGLQQDNAALTDKLSVAQNQTAAKKTENEQLQLKLAGLTNQISNLQAEGETLRQQNATLTQKNAALEKELAQQRNTAMELSTQGDRLRQENQRLSAALAQIQEGSLCLTDSDRLASIQGLPGQPVIDGSTALTSYIPVSGGTAHATGGKQQDTFFARFVSWGQWGQDPIVLSVILAAPLVLVVGLAGWLTWLVWKRRYVIFLSYDEYQKFNQWKLHHNKGARG